MGRSTKKEIKDFNKKKIMAFFIAGIILGFIISACLCVLQIVDGEIWYLAVFQMILMCMLFTLISFLCVFVYINLRLFQAERIVSKKNDESDEENQSTAEKKR